MKSRTYLSIFFYYGKKLNIFSKDNLHIVFVFVCIQRSWGGPKVQYGTIHKRCCPFYNFLITPFCQKYFTSIDGQMILTLSPHPLQIANVLYGGPLTSYDKEWTLEIQLLLMGCELVDYAMGQSIKDIGLLFWLFDYPFPHIGIFLLKFIRK